MKSKKPNTPVRTLLRCLLVCLIIAFVGFTILQALIFSAAHTEDAKVDCLIILGAGLYGETPSKSLVTRLEAALEYVKDADEIPIIVSGGQGPGETITEAEAMYRYLIRNGIDEKLIWKEEESTNTRENITYSLALLEQKGIDLGNITAAVVTNEFHLYRAKHIAGTLGFNAIGVAAKTPYLYLRVFYQCREAAALLKEFLL